jgi:hypothetical protein
MRQTMKLRQFKEPRVFSHSDLGFIAVLLLDA